MHILKKLEKNLEKIGKNLEKNCPVGGHPPPLPPPPLNPSLIPTVLPILKELGSLCPVNDGVDNFTCTYATNKILVYILKAETLKGILHKLSTTQT